MTAFAWRSRENHEERRILGRGTKCGIKYINVFKL
jgi:hypothetical protein